LKKDYRNDWDILNIKRTTLEKGIEKVAKKMLEKKLDISLITGLSEEELNKLKDK